MKVSTPWAMAAGLVLLAVPAAAQTPKDPAHYIGVSDFDGPDAELAPEGPPARYFGRPGLPPPEVYAVLRENGFLPLGIPYRRGWAYVIAALDRDGEDGRLIIDARSGQIVRFVPAFRMGSSLEDALPPPPEAAVAPASMPPPTPVRGVPRPPALIPHVASRSVPVPRAAPPRTGPAAAQTAAATKPADAQAQAAPLTTGSIGQTRPAAPAILPTQEMPPAQGLD